MKNGYTRKKVSNILGMPERAINYYTERRIIDPEVDKGEGRGKVRKYSRKNIVELGILKQLSGYGVAFKTVENVFSLLRTPYPIDLEKGEIENRGLIALWEQFKPNTYIVLYQMDNGEFHIRMQLGALLGEVLDKDKIKNSGSVLIINVGRIVELIKEL